MEKYYDVYYKENKLPDPLPDEEMEKYYRLFEEGDREAKDILLLHTAGLIIRIAEKYVTGRLTVETLFQTGCVGFIKALEKQPEGDLYEHFATYIEKEIIHDVETDGIYIDKFIVD